MKKIFFLALLSCFCLNKSFGQCSSNFTYVQFGNYASFINSSQGDSSIVYHWDFGDGDTSNLPNPQHAYLVADTFIVCLAISDTLGCIDMFCDTLIFQCAASFIANLGANNEAHFTDNSFGPGTLWSWDFGDGSIDSIQNPSHTYANTGTYLVCLNLSDSLSTCSSSYCLNVDVLCQAAFVPFALLGNEILFVDTSYGNMTNWSWDFGDGTTDTVQHPSHLYSSTGNFTVCLTASNASGSCVNMYCETVNVPCSGDFNFNVGFDNTVTFTDVSLGNPISWHWDFGDGDTSNLQHPDHWYAIDSTYYVCLTWSDSLGTCTGTVCDSVPVGINDGNCESNFTVNILGFNTIQITNTSTGNLTGYFWDFGDGTFSNAQDPNLHIYPASDAYTLCLTVVDSSTWCFDTHCVQVDLTVFDCIADYLYTTSDLDVSFQNLSAGSSLGTTWNWDFGDGTNETIKHPTHTFPASGTYNVCLNFFNALPPVCVSNTLCLNVNVIDTSSSVKSNGNDFGEYSYIYPNPSSGKSYLNLVLLEDTEVQVRIVDLSGKIIYSKKEKNTMPGENQIELPVAEFESGIYFIQTETSKSVFINKLIVLK